MSAVRELARAIDERIGFRAPLRRVARKLFPTHWSFLLGEITLFSFLGIVISGVFLAFFYRPSSAPAVYYGGDSSFAGRAVPDAFGSVLGLSVDVPFGLVLRRFHHFAAHLFIASLLLHAARVYFTGAFRRPREITWWIGLTLFALALVNGFTGYCLPFDMRGGTALRMMLTTLESVPWVGGWLATLVFGAPFPGPFIMGRLYIEHVFIGPALIASLIAAHLFLVVRLSHTDYPGPDRSDDLEVGAPAWPDQTARSTALAFLVFGTIAFLSAFFPVEAVELYGPFQPLSSYPPLSPDWFLMWVEGSFRLVPRQFDFHALGASFTNPFYGAVVLPILVFGGLVVYPLVDRVVYRRELQRAHLLEPWRERPFRTAVGVSGLGFLILLSLGVLNDRLASALHLEVWRVNVVLGISTLSLPIPLFVLVLWTLRRRRSMQPSSALVEPGIIDLMARGIAFSVTGWILAVMLRNLQRARHAPPPGDDNP
jgi:ubiquinol-cytochrome c reductase cytochrome b subunit